MKQQFSRYDPWKCSRWSTRWSKFKLVALLRAPKSQGRVMYPRGRKWKIVITKNVPGKNEKSLSVWFIPGSYVPSRNEILHTWICEKFHLSFSVCWLWKPKIPAACRVLNANVCQVFPYEAENWTCLRKVADNVWHVGD